MKHKEYLLMALWVAVVSAGCQQKTDQFPGYVQAAPEGPGAAFFYDPKSINLTGSGKTISVGVIKQVDDGYAVFNLATECETNNFMTAPGTQYSNDGTPLKTYESIGATTINVDSNFTPIVNAACDKARELRLIPSLAATKPVSNTLATTATHEDPTSTASAQPFVIASPVSYASQSSGHELSLRMEATTPNKAEISLNTATESGCSGALSGEARITGNTAVYTERPTDESPECIVKIAMNGEEARVSEQNCSAFHGSSCSFEGTLTKANTTVSSNATAAHVPVQPVDPPVSDNNNTQPLSRDNDSVADNAMQSPIRRIADASARGDENTVGNLIMALDANAKPVRGNRKAGRKMNDQGLAFFQAGAYSDAVAAFEAGVSLDPGDVEIANNYGFALLMAGRLDESKRVLEDVLTHWPTRGGAWTNVGQVYAKQGDHQSAVGAFLNTFRLSKDRNKTVSYFSSWLAKEEDPAVKRAVESALNESRTVVSMTTVIPPITGR